MATWMERNKVLRDADRLLLLKACSMMTKYGPRLQHIVVKDPSGTTMVQRQLTSSSFCIEVTPWSTCAVVRKYTNHGDKVCLPEVSSVQQFCKIFSVTLHIPTHIYKQSRFLPTFSSFCVGGTMPFFGNRFTQPALSHQQYAESQHRLS